MSRPTRPERPQPPMSAATDPSGTPQNRHYSRLQAPAGPAPLADAWAAAEEVRRRLLCVHGPATRDAYGRALSDAFGWLAAAGTTPLEATTTDLEHYRAALQDAGLAPATVALRLAALSGLYRLAVEQELLARSPMLAVRRPRVPRHSPHGSLDAGEVRSLLAGASAHSPRAEALVTVLVLTGLRVSALCDADVPDLIRHRRPWLLNFRNKGGRREVTVLPAKAASVLARYLGDRTAGPVFLSRTGRRLDRSSATRLVQRVAATVLPDRRDVTCHLLRAAYTDLALEAGVALHRVGASLGHADPVTTVQHYVRRIALLADHPSLHVAALLTGGG
jgi:integrase/recombinase XerD